MVGNTAQTPTPTFETAVVMCGGYATRDLRHSLIRPNTLGEIGNRNTLDIVAEDLAGVGVRNLVVVIPDLEAYPGVNITKAQIETWFRGNPKLQNILESNGKRTEVVEAAGSLTHGIENLLFAPQSQKDYGTAAALGAAAGTLETIGSHGFLVVNGDGFMHREDGGSDMADLISGMRQSGARHGLMTSPVQKIAGGNYKYGIIERDEEGRFVQIHEGAKAEEITWENPEGNVGAYAFDRSFLDYLDGYNHTPLAELNRPEYWLTDVVGRVAADEEVVAMPVVGRFVDCATPELRLKALRLIDPAAFEAANSD